MKYESFHQANIAICRALGLDPHELRSATIRLSHDHPPMVKVEYNARYVLDHDLDVDSITGEFVVVPVDPEPVLGPDVQIVDGTGRVMGEEGGTP